MASIQLRNINKSWGPVVAIPRLDLAIQDQEFLVLLGPSGCGKTTTMRMIAGLEEPTDGEVWIGDELMNHVPTQHRDVAMVFQNYGLYPHMTVRENIGYPLKVRGVPKPEATRRIEAAAGKVELGTLLDRKPSALSGGQRQRVALARALVREPSVFLMDEPLSNLDAKLRVTMRAELKHLHSELKVTTVYVTHDQIEAMTLASRIAVMNKGVIQQLGTPEQIYDDPANLFVAGFIGSPGMNFLRGDLTEGSFLAPSAHVPQAGRGSAKDVVLGVRPECLAIGAPSASAAMNGEVYAFELTGESTLVTVDVGGTHVCVRGGRRLRCREGETVGIELIPGQFHLFDGTTGERIRHH